MTDQITGTMPCRRAGAQQRARGTKRAQLIRMLQGKSGADVAAISAKLGWQPHTTRAALTRLRKEGLAISAEKGEGGWPMRYRIIAESAAAAAE